MLLRVSIRATLTFRLNREKNAILGLLTCCVATWRMAMDVSVRKELSDLVEKMTHSGLPSLEETQLKKLKRLCR